MRLSNHISFAGQNAVICLGIVRINPSSLELLDGCNVASCGTAGMETFFFATTTMILMTVPIMMTMMNHLQQQQIQTEMLITLMTFMPSTATTT